MEAGSPGWIEGRGGEKNFGLVIRPREFGRGGDGKG